MTLLGTVEFVALGFFVGAYGTIVGAGGGFIIVPILLILYGFPAQQAVGTSLVVVCFNAVSGTIAYVRAKRIDYNSGWKFALATLPGAAGGAYLSEYFTTRAFNGIFGALLMLLSVFLLLRPEATTAQRRVDDQAPLRPGWVHHVLVDAKGARFEYSFNQRGGIIASVGIGFLSSIFGIGGGIIHVPLLVFLFAFPAHIATATSHFILAITAAAGTSIHVALGHVVAYPAIAIGLGAVGGAQLGGELSHRIHGHALLRLLSIALAAVGVRLIWKSFQQ